MSAPARVWKSSALALTALLAACAGAQKPPAAAVPTPAGPVPEGPISPRFAWPVGLTAQVTYSTSRLRTGEDPESGESRYRMVVKGEGDALKVVSEDVELPPEEQKAVAAAEPVSIPTVVVNRGGDFLRVEGTEATLAKVDKLMEQQGQPAEQRQQVLGILRDAVVEGARETWHVQVAGWRGVTLEKGKPVTRQARMSPPALASVVVPVTETLTYEGAVPCAEGETVARCVRLTFEAKPVESELPGVRAAFLGRVKALAGAEAPDYQLDELRVEHRTELVTEPGSLIPHRVRTTRHTRVVFVEDKEKRAEDDQREEVEYVYVYDVKK